MKRGSTTVPRQRGRHFGQIAAIAVIGVIAASCSTAGATATTSTAAAAETTGSTTMSSTSTSIAVTTTTVPATATTTTIAANPEAVAVAEEFLIARQNRDIDALQVLLHDDVVLGWGPGKAKETVALGFLWEDASGIVFDYIECTPVGETTSGYEVLCTLTVDTAVAAALGDEPGCVPVSVYVDQTAVAKAELSDAIEGCGYNFWTKMFVPFNAWVREHHPETTPDAMYDDRISPEGLDMWRRLIDEFVAEQT